MRYQFTWAAAAVLFMGLHAADAQTIRTVCRDVINSYRVIRVCRQVVVPAPAPARAAPEPEKSAQRGPGTETTVQYDPAEEARKARGRAADPGGRDASCPPPWRWSPWNGCQPR